MKKIIIAFLLCFALVMPILPASATETEPTETTAASEPAATSEPTVTSTPTTPSEPTPSGEATEPAPSTEATDPVPPASGDAEEEETPTSTDPVNTDPTDPSGTPTDPTGDTTPNETTAPAHIEGCTEDCAVEDCICFCHEKSLFERLMACATLEELFAIVDETPEDELLALTEEENAQIESKIAQLEPEPLPPVVIEETIDVPVVSDIIYPTVNFDNVAPFGAPVEG